MRKALGAGLVVAGLVLAGCAGGQSSPGGSQPTQAEPATPKVPWKTLSLADPCSIITQSQLPGLGADQAPRTRQSNGIPVCTYAHGQAGTPGWGADIGLSGQTTFDDQTNGEPLAKTGKIGGYRSADKAISNTCQAIVEVSDKGYLSVLLMDSSQTPMPGLDRCIQAERLAEAAVQNLPNA